MADVVVNEIADRTAQTEIRRSRVEGHWIAKLFAFAPDRVVIIEAVDTEHIEPAGVAAADTELFGFGNRSSDQTAERDRFNADRLAMFEFGDRLFWRVHRDRTDRCDAIRIIRPGVDRELVERMASGAAQFLVADERREQLAMSRIEDREIDSHFLQPIMHQARN